MSPEDFTSIEERLKHSAFLQPAEGHALKVWRYMDLPKLVMLLRNQELFLSRLDRFEDPYEGSLTAKTIEWLERYFVANPDLKDPIDVVFDFYKRNVKRTFACCWHGNQHESEAMWRLYCPSGQGVAIQTTYGKLVEGIKSDPNLYVGCVRYEDFATYALPDANLFAVAMLKRASFSHEREVRIMASPSGELDRLAIPWDVDALTEHVYVNPYAPSYFYDAAVTVIEALAPSIVKKVCWSGMRAAPLFGAATA
jgi:hypothetical protein